jgi:hypothetical protein
MEGPASPLPSFSHSLFPSFPLSAVRKAGDGTRTRDPQLGRLMLYQLSYTRVLSGAGCPLRAEQRGRGAACSDSDLTSPALPMLASFLPRAPLPICPASMVGVGFEPT